MNIINKKFADKIFYLGANDTQINKFENLWDIPQGISYNCYFINDKKTALIDTVEEKFSDELIDELKKLLDGKSLDYLIINHMEPDHSGTILKVIEEFPKIKLVGNHKTTVFAKGFYDLEEEKFLQVKDGNVLNLGKYQLEFNQTPMVHWPESMVCYEKITKTLFSSDIFGGYKTITDQSRADLQKNLDEYIDQARAYFATVIGGYTRPALSSIKKLKKIQIECIAPAHGLVWQSNHQQIFDLYKRWSQYLPDDNKHQGVTIAIGSMYGHTWQIGELISTELKKTGLAVDLLDASQTSQTELLNCVWKNQGLIIGSCTYNNGLFPPIKSLLDALIERKLQNKFLGVFSSHSWTGGAMRFLDEFVDKTKLTAVEPKFETQYKMRGESKKNAILLAKNMSKTIMSK